MQDLVGRLVAAVRSGDWLDYRRIRAYSAMLLALEILTFLFFVAGTHGLIVPLDKPATTDFVSFYAAGSLADKGMPEASYDHALHLAAEERATEPGIGYVIFVYPPVFMLLCAALATLPYLLAFILFEAATLIPCILVLRCILNEKGWAVLLPLLAFPAVLLNFGVGQNAFLTASFFGGALLLIDRRPALAGLLIGCLCYKPHFGLLFPVALLAAGRWRAIAAAIGTIGALILLSGTLLGWETWRSFLITFGESHSIYESGQVDFAAFVSPFGAMKLLGFSSPVAYFIQVIASLIAAGLVAFVWRQNFTLPTRAATLAAATLVALPLALFYDLMLAAVAIAWLIRGGRESSFLNWEKMLLLTAFIVPILARSLGKSLHFPLAATASFVLIALCCAHAYKEQMLSKRHSA